MTKLYALALFKDRVHAVDLADGAVDTVLDDTGPAPDGIVVHGDRLYWTTMGEPSPDPARPGRRGDDYSAKNGGVHTARRDGSGRRALVPPGTVTTGKQLVFDGEDTLYWGDREGYRVSRVRLDGSGQEDLIVNPGTDPVSDSCVGVAVDRERGHLYWTQKGPSDGGRGRIFRAGIDVPAGERPENRSDVETLWDGLPEPIDLELVGGTLYWTDRGAAESGGNTLNRARIPAVGQRGEEPEILAGGFTEAIGLAVDEDAGVVYVSDLGGTIVEVALPESGRPGRTRVIADLRTPLCGITLAE
ncbi:MAG: hypothetical protein QM809_17925 [Gordonia sp. (in: high G+C Gram-positive bacteria)]|uniref:hypothetical protein n=1 Tax=Gordonia sp. (in: high G+C Gram-positive bacteria) TaxID=84139 RepID=UPI0039E542AB